MSKAAIQLAGTTIPAGERGFGYLHVNTLAARTEVRVPFQVINGAEDGPTLCLEATQHGWEPMGAEVIRRATQRIDPKTLKGTIYCLPLAHPFTVEFGGTIESAGQRVSPADNLDINQTWPGAKENAWLTQQIAYVLWNEVIKKCDTILDYHDGTGAADELPVAFAHAFPDNPPYYAGAGIEGLEGKDTNPPVSAEDAKKMNEQIMGMAKAFGSSIIWWRQYMLNPKMLTAQCALNGIVPLVVETGGGGMIDATIEPSVTCTMNILKYLGMIDGEAAMPEEQVMVTNYKVYRSLTGGFYLKEPGRDIGTMVEKGDVLGQVVDPVTSEVLETCTAPVSGMLVSTRVRMPINPGGYIAHLADFDSIIWQR